ncbi:MAG TPA: hypothetical protein VF981_14645 [Gemmatimonadaceae bacterium]
MERRLLVTGFLAALGAAVGAAAAPLLSFLATTVANVSLPAGRIGYFFDPTAFAVVGAIGIPALAWLLMRTVPLWRAVVEPTVGGALGLLLALASIPLVELPLIFQPLLILAGTVGAALRLRRAHQPVLASAAASDRISPAS